MAMTPAESVWHPEPDAAAFPAKFVSKTDDADFLLLKLERTKTAAAPKAGATK